MTAKMIHPATDRGDRLQRLRSQPKHEWGVALALSLLYAYSAMSTPLGTRIRALREAMDLSLREFARKLDETSPAHVSDIELGRRYPSDKLLEMMAKVLKVSFAELQQLDARPPVDELRRRGELDPKLGFALRKVIEEGVSSEELMKMLNERSTPGKEEKDS